MMCGRFKNAEALKFSINKLSLKIVSTVKNNFSSALFKIIFKFAVIGVETFLLLFTVAWKLIIFELSFVCLFLIFRYIFSLNDLAVLEVAYEGSSIFFENTLAFSSIIVPLSFIVSSIRPR